MQEVLAELLQQLEGARAANAETSEALRKLRDGRAANAAGRAEAEATAAEAKAKAAEVQAEAEQAVALAELSAREASDRATDSWNEVQQVRRELAAAQFTSSRASAAANETRTALVNENSKLLAEMEALRTNLAAGNLASADEMATSSVLRSQVRELEAYLAIAVARENELQDLLNELGSGGNEAKEMVVQLKK